MSPTKVTPRKIKSIALHGLADDTGPATRIQGKGHRMTSTWYLDPANRQFRTNPLHWLAYRSMYKGPPQGVRTEKIGVFGVWQQHLFIFPRTLPPMVAQYISMHYFGYNWPPWVAYTTYSVWLVLAIQKVVKLLNILTEKHGYLDGASPRDHIPDVRVKSTMTFLLLTIFLRPALASMIVYDRFELPHISPWLPVHMALYPLAVDFWFYLYHRAMHEVPWLWKFHKTHHTTRHPTPLLSAFADPEQDFCDILLIPLLAWCTYRIDFHTWWICLNYLLFVEASGHSGLRVEFRSPHPFNYPLLNWLGMDLALEDHDLHHRKGWRRSHNYGKQSRIWDTLFHTKGERIELVPENMAYNFK